MLRISKWYLDLVTDDGTALVVYVVSVGWSGVRIDVASTLFAPADAPPVERTVWTGVSAPESDGETARFRHDGLGVAGEWRRASPPLAATLLAPGDGEGEGEVRWWCGYPSASAAVEIDGRKLGGCGYVELLTMTRPPWTLPLRQLRWGRYASPSHAAVWIDWSGGPPRRWAWLDGAPRGDATLDGERVVDLGGGASIEVHPVRELCDRRSLRILSARLPALAPLFPGPLGELRDVKRLARGTLRCGAAVDEGWIVDEVVSW